MAVSAFPFLTRTVADSDAKAPAILDTRGRAYFTTGDKINALEAQRKAVPLLLPGDSPTRTALEVRLANFEVGGSEI